MKIKRGKNDDRIKEGDKVTRLLMLRTVAHPPPCPCVAVVFLEGSDFDESRVAGGMDLISHTAAL